MYLVRRGMQFIQKARASAAVVVTMWWRSFMENAGRTPDDLPPDYWLGP